MEAAYCTLVLYVLPPPALFSSFRPCNRRQVVAIVNGKCWWLSYVRDKAQRPRVLGLRTETLFVRNHNYDSTTFEFAACGQDHVIHSRNFWVVSGADSCNVG
jgi:hypothetical protein